MKKFSSYKDSGVVWLREIPSEWKINKIKYLASLPKEQVSVSAFKDKEVVHYSIPNVQALGTGSLESGADIDSSKLILYGGEIIISKLNPRKSTISIVREHSEMIVASGEFVVIKPTDIERAFLYYVIISKPYTEFLDAQTESVTRSHQRVNPEVIHNSIVAYPTRKVQDAIVSFLDDKTSQIDALISNSEKKIELLKEKRTALINQVVTKGLDPNVKMKDSGVDWIGEIPLSWTVGRLGYYTTKVGSGSTPRGGSEIYSGYGVKFIRSQNVYNSGLRLEDVVFITEAIHRTMRGTNVRMGDLLLNITGGSIGRCCIVNIPDEMNVNQHVSIIRTKETLLNYYLNYFLQSNSGQSQVEIFQTGGNREGLTADNIKSFSIVVPLKEEQQQIVKYLDHHTAEIDKEVSLEQRRIELLKEYRQSLISEVVTGKINVLDYAS